MLSHVLESFCQVHAVSPLILRLHSARRLLTQHIAKLNTILLDPCSGYNQRQPWHASAGTAA